MRLLQPFFVLLISFALSPALAQESATWLLIDDTQSNYHVYLDTQSISSLNSAEQPHLKTVTLLFDERSSQSPSQRALNSITAETMVNCADQTGKVMTLRFYDEQKAQGSVRYQQENTNPLFFSYDASKYSKDQQLLQAVCMP